MPFQGMRLYELLTLAESPQTAGRLRKASRTGRGLMISWTRAVEEEVERPAEDTELRVDRALAAGNLWVWEDNETIASMAVRQAPAIGVVRYPALCTA